MTGGPESAFGHVLDLLDAILRSRASGRLVGGADGRLALLFHGGFLVGAEPPPTAGTSLRQLAVTALVSASGGGFALRFEPGPSSAAKPDAHPAAGAADLIAELLRACDPAGIRACLSGGQLRPAPSGSAATAALTLTLTPAEKFLLSRADGSLGVDEILVLSPASEEDTMKGLFVLIALGLLTAPGFEWRRAARTLRAPGAAAQTPAPAAAPKISALDAFLNRTGEAAGPPAEVPEAAGSYASSPADEEMRRKVAERLAECEGADMYKILGVSPTADDAAIRRAYYAMAKNFHPDLLRRLNIEDILPEVESMFARTTEAYNVLTDPGRRAEYDRHLAERKGGHRPPKNDTRGQARESFLRGKKHFEAGEFFDALNLFETACNLDSGKAEYWSHLGRVQEKNSRWRKRAEESYLKAIQLDPMNYHNYLYLGRLYKAGNLTRRAHEMFEKVLSWDPENQEALEALGRKAPQQQSGVKGRIFSMFKGSKS